MQLPLPSHPSGTRLVPVQSFRSVQGVPGGAKPVGLQTPLWQNAEEAQVLPGEHWVLSATLSPAQKMFPEVSCWQRSNFVQGLPSLHPQAFGWLESLGVQPVDVLVRATWTHPVPSGGASAGLQVSMLQLFPSSQRTSIRVEMQVPLPSQTSAVQTIPSLFSQLVPAARFG
jgi:hypothetical protein